MKQTPRNIALIGVVGETWNSIRTGGISDLQEMQEVLDKRKVDRVRKFLRSLADARQANIPWTQLSAVGTGVSTPTLKKYAKGAGIE
jgi:hypothetical protein